MSPRALTKRLVKAVVALELLGLFGAYGLFHRMNDSRDFRNTVNRRFPSVLEEIHTDEKVTSRDPEQNMAALHMVKGVKRYVETSFCSCFLPVYYQSNEWAGVNGIRERDHEAWSAKQD